MPRRVTRSSSTRTVRVSKQEAAVRDELKRDSPSRPRRRRKAEVRAGAPDPGPKPRARRTRRRTASGPTDTRIVHLAMSPKAANYLRTMLGKARYEESELDAIKKELEDQLEEMGL